MRLAITDDMREANGVEAMADAFHPTQTTGASYHDSAVMDAIEGALLFGAGRIGKSDLLDCLSALPEWIEVES